MEPNPRLSLSEERLRAALAEMELRLRIYFDEQLKHKADQSQVLLNTALLSSIDRGEFSPSHRRALAEFIDEHMSEKRDEGWTATQRIMGVVGICFVIFSFTLSFYVAVGKAALEGIRGDNPPAQIEEDPSG